MNSSGAKNLSLLCDIKRLVSQAQIGDTLRRVGLNPSDKKALPQIFSRHEAAPWNRSRYR